MRYLLLLTQLDGVPVAWWSVSEYWEARAACALFADRVRQPERELMDTLPKVEPDMERIMLAEVNGFRLWYVRNASD